MTMEESFDIAVTREHFAGGTRYELKLHAAQHKRGCRLKYGAGELVIWDNATLPHLATLIDPVNPRTVWRTTVK